MDVKTFMAQQTRTGGGQFSATVRKFADKAQARLDLVVKKVLFDMSARLVEMSPVGNRELWAVNIDRRARGLQGLLPKGYVGGRFRANWQYGDGQMPEGTIGDPKGTSWPQAAAVTGKLAAQIANTARFGGTYWLVNNLPYSIPLEYGWSKQAPNGMVRITAQEFKRYVDNAVRSL